MTPALNGETQVVFIIGDPIAQVKSPSLLSARFARQGQNTLVVPGHVAPADIPAFMAGLDTLQNAPGLVITVPHKQAMVPYCAKMTDRARYAGSVNVMRRTAAGWMGDNTDGMGYVEGMKERGAQIEGKRVLLVGAGGAGSAIAYEFLAQGASMLAVHDVDASRRDGLIDRLGAAFPGQLAIGSGDPTGFDIIANATPLGMRDGDPLPVQVDNLQPEMFAACPITKPEISPFIAAAMARGCDTMPGIGMFTAQEGLLVEALNTLSAD
ncbi:shikimate dehydrogenase family protein [Pseudoprimorskyibacter insulae]|uniref:Shikimate dehydrogenase (NADP(+)) n=1 Tax=Pseudoprimorskyibacter insulae TaxID=1695997 RepID=A0A2R8AYG8_9RHOB|nr:shikimate dehydrogenase [Pseudoprimorskyibacter insulae]SPF80919.1 Shikimate dehydrogenase (NADP(+)) [Pseudoprimorskyibacter insulae]